LPLKPDLVGELMQHTLVASQMLQLQGAGSEDKPGGAELTLHGYSGLLTQHSAVFEQTASTSLLRNLQFVQALQSKSTISVMGENKLSSLKDQLVSSQAVVLVASPMGPLVSARYLQSNCPSGPLSLVCVSSRKRKVLQGLFGESSQLTGLSSLVVVVVVGD
jgi:hypothetical protein